MRYVVIFIFFFINWIDCRAQGNPVNVSIKMPPVALIDILSSGSGNVSLSAIATSEAGNALNTSASNGTNWLVFTSAVVSGSRNIKADLIGTLPPGIRLKLVISPYTGSGQGVTGGNSYITGNVYITNSPAIFIDNIRGAFTGITYGSDGFKLNYSLEVQNYGNIRSGTSSLTIHYTMADN